MQFKTTVVVAVIWAASLMGAVVWAQGGGAGTVIPRQGVDRQGVRMLGDAYGPAIAGEDFGIQRVAGPADRGKVLGRLMVRVDGEWREVQFPAFIVRD